MNFRIGIITLFSIIAGSVCGQEGIDFSDKTLLRYLEKEGIQHPEKLMELSIPDSLEKKYSIDGKYFIIDPDDTIEYRSLYVGRVISCRAGGCSRPGKSSNENPEYFDYYILFDKLKKIEAVRVYNYQATHGYEITAKGWLKQFYGYDGSGLLEVNKNIDAISGATISVNAITADIELQSKFLRDLNLD